MKSADLTQPPIISSHQNRIPLRRWLLWMVVAAALVVAVVLFAFNPEQTNFYPICVLKNEQQGGHVLHAAVCAQATKCCTATSPQRFT